jgi:hypothetical protein
VLTETVAVEVGIDREEREVDILCDFGRLYSLEMSYMKSCRALRSSCHR